jgi:hypothetical protein
MLRIGVDTQRRTLGLFPCLPGQSGYNKRLRKLAVTMCWPIRVFACDTTLWDDDVWAVDSTPVESTAGRKRLSAARIWPAAPSMATAPATPLLSGLRLHLLTTLHGLPAGFAITGPRAASGRCSWASSP